MSTRLSDSSSNYFRKVGMHAVSPAQETDDLSIVASDDEHSSSGGLDDNRVSTGSHAKNAPKEMVRRETRVISILRYFNLGLLLVSAIGISIGFHRLVSEVEETTDECSADTNHLDNFVQGLETNLQQIRSSRLSSAFALSASFSSYVLESGIAIGGFPMQWPFVTIPHFDIRALGPFASNDVVEVVMAPLITPPNRNSFQTYALLQQQEECTFEGCKVVRDIYNVDGASISDEDTTSPVWQISPYDITDPGYLLMNQFSDPVQRNALTDMLEQDAAVWSGFDLNFADASDMPPEMILFYPIYQDFKQVEMVGSVSLRMDLKKHLAYAIPFSVDEELSIVLQSCDSAVAFSLEGEELIYDGTIEIQRAEALKAKPGTSILDFPPMYPYGQFKDATSDTSGEACSLTVVVASANHFQRRLTDGGSTNRAALVTSLVAVTFLALILVFLIYDWLVERRQSVVISIATKSTAIVENLFPAQVRDRMLQNIEDKKKNKGGMEMDQVGVGDAGATPVEPLAKGAAQSTNAQRPSQVSVKQFLTTDQVGQANDLSSQPIADLFPNTTVLFADIAGFTAWASQREPPQVFTLLETLYRSFDVIAKKLKVFKVETIGDCYMAVTGLPSPDDAHAVHMSRFAYQCLMGMKELIRELEAMLGPGTSDLALRVGLHSGAVTAGVLRGEKSRFQLFGDTVNTASRMESTSERGRIQVSQETADLLMAAGKSHWLKPREDLVVAKGKGELKTYWLDPTKKRRQTKTHKDIRVSQEIAINNGSSPSMGLSDVAFDDKYARLIDWNVDVLLHHLARVISCRSRSPSRGSLVNHSSETALLPAAINDVAEVVALPPFDADSSKFRRARPDVSMLQQTRADLHEYVKRIALLYRDVPFHNFEHASHVTLCANKLLNRLINSDEYESEEALHNATYGISSDPLTHFAIVFAALIHDADHTGVPNAQLVKDNDEVAMKFGNKSVAEQNSVHLGWELLMDPRFERLRKCIYQTNVERKRFRQLVINSVLATDIADRQVNENRQMKWDKAFNKPLAEDATPLQMQEDMNRKGTAVIEHIIQVSDVAHTMQHWHIYRRWNERLFHEMHEAYQTGRVAVDPSTNWYIGELGFFDYYLIPLAMKLKECGVFGASGYEYISYVLKNKKEWERKGRQVVQEMVLLYKDADEDQEESSFDSDYDSDDIEYDSPGDMSLDDEEDDLESMDPLELDR